MSKILVLINRLREFLFSTSFLVGLLLFLLPTAAYLKGRGDGSPVEVPEIVIDTEEIDCGCENWEVEGVEDDAVGATETTGAVKEPEAVFVASKNGEKYYPLDCSWADRIKEENKVFYGSIEEAEADGKEASSACE